MTQHPERALLTGGGSPQGAALREGHFCESETSSLWRVFLPLASRTAMRSSFFSPRRKFLAKPPRTSPIQLTFEMLKTTAHKSRMKRISPIPGGRIVGRS